MARYVNYRCPECREKFKYLHHPNDAPPPDRCPLCNAWVSNDEPPEEVFVPQAPGIRKSTYVKAVDQSYRAMEESSAQRAEEAADHLRTAYASQERETPHDGDRAVLGELEKHQIDEIRSGLKITNMRDPSEMREGDTAVIQPDTSAAAARLSAGGLRPTFQQQAAPQGGGGITPFVQNFTKDHSSRATGMIRAGEMGRHR